MMQVLLQLVCVALAVMSAGCAMIAVRRIVGRAGSHDAAWWRRLVAPLAGRLRPGDAAELQALEVLLAQAGRRGRDAVDRFLEDRAAAIAGGLALALGAAVIVGGSTGALLGLTMVVGAIVGPGKQVAWQARARRDAIADHLPPAVDLLTTCIDAGLPLDRALARVARETGASGPGAEVLADELGATSAEIGAGVAVPDALRRLARRVGQDELSALCGVLAQAHGLGAPVATTLREYAESSRRQRMSALEERAGKLAARLTLPLAVCLLPAALAIILGPAVLQLIEAFH